MTLRDHQHLSGARFLRSKDNYFFFYLFYINSSCELHMLEEGKIPGTQVPQAKASLNGRRGKAVFGNPVSEW